MCSVCEKYEFLAAADEIGERTSRICIAIDEIFFLEVIGVVRAAIELSLRNQETIRIMEKHIALNRRVNLQEIVHHTPIGRLELKHKIDLRRLLNFNRNLQTLKHIGFEYKLAVGLTLSHSQFQKRMIQPLDCASIRHDVHARHHMFGFI